MNFDTHALNYDQALNRGVRLSGAGPAWFARQRVQIVKAYLHQCQHRVRKIIEFGCGTGNHMPHLTQAFPEAQIVGVDISRESLNQASQRYDQPHIRFCLPEDLSDESHADLIYANGVFHHIPPKQHANEIARLHHWLKPGGRLAVFDNNPLSLPARVVMKLIPFDKEAVMVKPRRLRDQLQQAGLHIEKQQYHFVFPNWMPALQFLESRMTRWPIGAQFVLFAAKPGTTSS
jgi:trans-aconitate methyltransferase